MKRFISSVAFAGLILTVGLVSTPQFVGQAQAIESDEAIPLSSSEELGALIDSTEISVDQQLAVIREKSLQPLDVASETIAASSAELSSYLDAHTQAPLYDVFEWMTRSTISNELVSDFPAHLDYAVFLEDRRAEIEADGKLIVDEAVRLSSVWETAVATEIERLRIEAEAKAAAEEAARQAAISLAQEQARRQSANNSTPSRPSANSGGSSTAAPNREVVAPPEQAQGEDASGRVSRLMGRLGISIGFRFGPCGTIANALGCYAPGSGTIVFTDRGLGRDDCTVMRIITHEYRHYQQDMQGLIELDSWGGILNRDWLESDAASHTYCK